jgi:peptidoglycan/xylan/chitin deacetylase (PgdA/CDA1 family)
VFRRRAARRLVVLGYHGIDDARGFRRQLELVISTMRPVALADVAAAVAGERGLPERAVLITFDDCGPSHLETVLPLLREHEVPAVAFAVAGPLGTDEPFWFVEALELARRGVREPALAGLPPEDVVRALKAMPDGERRATLLRLRENAPGPPVRTPQLRPEDLRELESGGIAVGSHTLTHPCLTRCDPERLELEVAEAHSVLTRALGHPPTAFAYPNGDWDGPAIDAVRRAGYRVAFAFDHRLQSMPAREPLAISRVRVHPSAGLDRFRITVSGLRPALHHALGRP